MEYNVQFSSQNDKVSTDVNVQGGKTFALHLFKTGQTLEATMQSNEQELDASFSSMQVVGGGGSDGFSPIVDVEPIEGGHRLTVTDAQGTETADIMDGQDGISPVVSVEDIDGGHRVTITDKDGEKTFDVMDGKDGTGGSGGAAVQSDWAVNDENDPAFVKNRTHWVERPYEPIVVTPDMVGAEGVDTIDMSIPMGYPAGTIVLYKVNDHVLTTADTGVSKVYITRADDGKDYSGLVTVVEIEGMQGFYSVDCYVFADDSNQNENTQLFSVAVSGDFTDTAGIIIPSTGLYIMAYDSMVASFEINADTYHAIGKRYLPPTKWSDLQGKPTIGWSDLTGTLNVTWEQLQSKPAIEGGTNAASLLLNSARESSGIASHAEGDNTTASGTASHAEGDNTTASGTASHAEGFNTTASRTASHAEGLNTTASKPASHAEGNKTIASGTDSHVQGRLNIEDTVNKYAHIVGNGIEYPNQPITRSNAHTLDWDGVPWYQGRPQFGGVEQDNGAQTVMANGDTEIILKSPNGSLWGITVSDDGTLTATAK